MHKKLYLLIISFLCVTLTLSTTVYAWFSLTRTNMIEGIEIGISLDDNITLSLDGINYHKSISNDDLFRVIGTNPNLSSITSQDGITFYKGPLKTTARATPNADYISFNLYFRLTSENPNESAHLKYIYLANRMDPLYDEAENYKGTFITSIGKYWTNPIDYHDGLRVIPAGMNRLYYAKNAVRISSIGQNSAQSFIYDVSEDRYRGFGKTFGAYDYYKNRLGIELEIPEAPTNEIFSLTKFSKLQNDVALDKKSLLSELQLVSYENGIYTYQGMTTINIWLEGWDADAFDPILDDKLKISLSIKAARYDETYTE
ncbi:hypothetical protein [Acholeplasma granularum]|uniref:hypothetical protein n=1 Tax=Acholeplasma granularum TaxID=264635 RepID=UPI00046ED584|nr:hypothetical protein [Acholeplasma granularum]